ncbi:MAG: transglycosylase domain-containing protein, partial [Flavobacteriales bacterium]|nr:transglycosylase domain-containing protein [Flavobacteriales bacterium]
MAKEKKNMSSRKKLLILWILVVSPFLFFFVLMWGANSGSLGFNELPSLEELENPKSNLASEIITSDGKVMGKYFLQNRTNVQYNDLSPHLVDALIATEDARFREHSGIDFRGLMRAVVRLGRAGGASTITQQLAKMMFHERETATLVQKIKQKLQEQIIAVELEKRYTKDEIISMYFNQFDFLNNAVGVESAAGVYFNKAPKDLELHEAAMLVGMAKNPSLFNPLRRPEMVQKRREVVLDQMRKYGYITQEQYDSTRVLPLGLDYKVVDHKEGMAPYFRETLRLKLQELLDQKDEDGNYRYAKSDGKPYNIYKDGLKIYTTINSKMQGYAEWAVEEYIAKTLQPQFDKHLHKYRTKRYPYDGGWKGINEEQYTSIMEISRKRTARYRILTGQECQNCGNRGKWVKKEGRYYVCHADGCGFKKWATDKDSVDIIFDKKIPMKIFSHQGTIDTTLSPNDS